MKIEDFQDEKTPQAHAAKTIKYVKPNINKAKGVVLLAKTDIIAAAVQVVNHGGETNMHSHTGMDGLWFVLKGKARFYTEGDVVLGEFGVHEGAFIPRGVAYWFESASDEPLEILQVEAIAKGEPNKRVDYTARAQVTKDFEFVDLQQQSA